MQSYLNMTDRSEEKKLVFLALIDTILNSEKEALEHHKEFLAANRLRAK